MSNSKTVMIDFGEKRLHTLAMQAYEKEDYISALRYVHKGTELYGETVDNVSLLCDIYETLGLYASATNYWYKFLHICDEEDLPEIYEGLATAYLNMNNDERSAYYYNLLLDVDDTITDESKQEIIDAFAKNDDNNLKFSSILVRFWVLDSLIQP